MKPATRFRKGLLRSAKEWPCTAASASHVSVAAQRFSAFATRRTRRTTVPTAKPAASSWQIARSRVSCAKTGQRLLRNLDDRCTVRGVKINGENYSYLDVNGRIIWQPYYITKPRTAGRRSLAMTVGREQNPYNHLLRLSKLLY